MIFIALSASGCVERIIRIESDPPGARVFLDGAPAGETPVDVPFIWYGRREIILEKPGYNSVKTIETIPAPWWQIFPFDFITDVLLPFPLRDIHVLRYVLKPFPAGPDEFEETRRRAEEFRGKTAEKED